MKLPRSGSLPRCVALAASVAVVLGGAMTTGAGADVTPLPDEGSVDQVVAAPAGWNAGADGHGVDVALVDTGVTPVAGLNATNKLVYGPDLSFDSQDPNAAYLDGGHHRRQRRNAGRLQRSGTERTARQRESRRHDGRR